MNTEHEGERALDERLSRLAAVTRPDDFWIRQRNRILSRLEPRRSWSQTLAWSLVPFFAGAAGVFIVSWLMPGPAAPPASGPAAVETVPPPRDWEFLEKLELLENIDKLRPPAGVRS